MKAEGAPSGVYSAAATPVEADGTFIPGLFADHCRGLLANGADGIALLGTTGEANSFSVAERKAILETALDAGISPDRLAPGTGVCALPEAIELTRHAIANGVHKVLALPPFYYKGVGDDGLFSAYARLIEGVGDPRVRIVLYHFPQMSGVPLSHALIARLVEAFPEQLVGIKDSSGDFDNMKTMAERFPTIGVMAGADPLMLKLLPLGGAGCITATSNLIAPDLRQVFDRWQDADGKAAVEAAQARISARRALCASYPLIPAIKALLGLRTGDARWNNVRPPLVPLTQAQNEAIAREWAATEDAGALSS